MTTEISLSIQMLFGAKKAILFYFLLFCALFSGYCIEEVKVNINNHVN